KPDAIMISHTDPKAMIPPLKQAKDAGIKIMTIDGDLADTSIAVANIQSNNLEGGRLAGEKMGKLLGGKGSVITIDNYPGFPISGGREANKVGKIHIVGYDTSDPIVQALHDKKLDGDIVQYPYGEGIAGIETLVKATKGQSVQRNQSAPFVVADPTNVDTPKV